MITRGTWLCRYIYGPPTGSSSGTWTRLSETLSSFEKYGSAVALSDKVAVVSCPTCDSDVGKVFVYTADNQADRTGSWSQVAALAPVAPATSVAGEQFANGKNVAVHGTSVVVGAPSMPRPSDGASTGAVFLYEPAGGDPSLSWSGSMLPIPDLATADCLFGQVVAINAELIVATAPQQTAEKGALYVWRRDAPSTSAPVGPIIVRVPPPLCVESHSTQLTAFHVHRVRTITKGLVSGMTD